MSDARRHAYLEAMEIPAWVLREADAPLDDGAPCGLHVGPGSSPVLLVCSAVDEPASRIAADLARCLEQEPVWAWPDQSKTNGLSASVSEHMFTTVVILGREPGKQLLGSDIPETVGSARVLAAPAIGELAGNPAAKRKLWRLMTANRLVRSQAGG